MIVNLTAIVDMGHFWKSYKKNNTLLSPKKMDQIRFNYDGSVNQLWVWASSDNHIKELLHLFGKEIAWTEYDYNKADHLTIDEFGPILIIHWRNLVFQNAMNISA